MKVLEDTDTESIADKEAGNDGKKMISFRVSRKSVVESDFKCDRNENRTKIQKLIKDLSGRRKRKVAVFE